VGMPRSRWYLYQQFICNSSIFVKVKKSSCRLGHQNPGSGLDPDSLKMLSKSCCSSFNRLHICLFIHVIVPFRVVDPYTIGCGILLSDYPIIFRIQHFLYLNCVKLTICILQCCGSRMAKISRKNRNKVNKLNFLKYWTFSFEG
jgi:hypothetical protein